MNLDIRFYWKLLLRRFPVMALMFTVCTALAAFTAMRMPETFNTSARLLVEEPQIPNSMVQSIVRTGAVEQLDIIQQRLLTRANLIDIANRFDVYEDLRTAEPDTIVQRMTQAIRINRSAGRNSATLMTISFRGRSGQVVANVVNELVTLVLEENVDFRMSRSENTLDFFEQQVNRLGSELDAQSARIATFKGENSEALPENQSFRLGRQSLLQERLSRLERDLRTITAQRNDIETLFEATGEVGQSESGPIRTRTSEEQQLAGAKTDLQQALLIYTPENPRVVRLQGIVDRLEALVATQTSGLIEGAVEDDVVEAITPAQAMFQATIVEIDNRIEAISGELEGTQQELDAVQSAISASSINGIQLNALERDFAAIQTRFNAAVANLNQAQMSEQVEATAQGQRITVIENANVPRLASGPNRARVIMMGAALGAGLAGGFFVLLELLNRTIRRPAELTSKFNLMPIATIPYLESRGRRAMRRLVLIIGSLIALIGVPLVLWYIDTNYMPLDLLVQKALARLGFM